MEAETFSLLKSFQQEKIISVQFSLWLALLWLKDQLFKKLWLCPKSCHINPEPTVYFYKHVINLTDWPGFVTGTLPHFHSPCFLISMYWGLKAQLYFQESLCDAQDKGASSPIPQQSFRPVLLNDHLWLIQLLTATLLFCFGSKAPNGKNLSSRF